jgi:hypothetical protein
MGDDGSNMDAVKKTGSVVASVIFGILFLLVILVLTFSVENPTPTQQFVIRVVLALAAAGFAAMLPGFIELGSNSANVALRAGGSIALFLVVFFLTPQAFEHPAPAVGPGPAAQETAANTPQPQLQPPAQQSPDPGQSANASELASIAPAAGRLEPPAQAQPQPFTPPPMPAVQRTTGSLVMLDGGQFQGEMLNGLPDGRGIVDYPALSVRYDGMFVAGVLHGQGVFLTGNGMRCGVVFNNNQIASFEQTPACQSILQAMSLAGLAAMLR